VVSVDGAAVAAAALAYRVTLFVTLPFVFWRRVGGEP
jgi:hypothetical protein